MIGHICESGWINSKLQPAAGAFNYKLISQQIKDL